MPEPLDPVERVRRLALALPDVSDTSKVVLAR